MQPHGDQRVPHGVSMGPLAPWGKMGPGEAFWGPPGWHAVILRPQDDKGVTGMIRPEKAVILPFAQVCPLVGSPHNPTGSPGSRP